MLWERITYKITTASFPVALFSVLTFIRTSSMISPCEMLLAHGGNNMGEQLQEPLGFQPGDKIRVRSGTQTGARGIIQAEKEGKLEIQLDDGITILIEPGDITNYSLAARRAWQVMPKRAGRPQLSSPRKKMVSMRIDVEVWNRLGEAVNLGLIPSREEAVNAWLREHLESLLNESPHLRKPD